MRVRLESIGCRLNIGEIEAMARQFAGAGHRIVGPGESADLCIFNSCTVTAVATKKSRSMIRRLRRRHPGARIVVTGCHAELQPEEVRALGVDVVIGNRDKDEIPGILAREGLLGEPDFDPADDPLGTAFPSTDGHTRAFLKVQDGCDQRCSFCVVTIARGEGRSRDADSVVAEVRRLGAGGFKEIVLTGVHLGSYGADFAPSQRESLAALVRRILAETDVPRLRLSSLEPWDLDDDFFAVFDDPRVLPHVHLPLQSGCDATLRRMARRTSRAEYAVLVDSARRRIPGLSVTTDIMVGFPGETDVEFEESLAFVESMAFSGVHVFRFSSRQGTPAAGMKDQIPASVAQERSQRVHRLASRLEEAYRHRFIGRTASVLWESSEETDGGRRWSGLTGNYIRVVSEDATGIDFHNAITDTLLVGPAPGGLVGRVVDGTAGATG